MLTLAPTLTDRQAELLTLLACGHTVRSAAEAMGIAYGTAHCHATEARLRLGARRTAQACIIAREMGLIHIPLSINSTLVL